ncbi:MAG: histidine kinase [Candidatus Eisenbacteria bacterium]
MFHSRPAVADTPIWRYLAEDPVVAAAARGASVEPSTSDPRWTFVAEGDEPAGAHAVAGADDGVVWLSREWTIPTPPGPFDHYTLRIAGCGAAWDAWWDGVPVGQNGVIASGDEGGTPGTWASWVSIPPELTSVGVHRLSIRTSTAGGALEWSRASAVLALDSEWDDWREEASTRSRLCAGVFLMAGVYCFALFLGGGGQRPYLFFALHLLTCALAVVRGDPAVPTHLNARLFRAWLDLSPWLLGVSGWLLIAFFVRVFLVPFRRRHDWAAMVVALVPPVLLSEWGPSNAVLPVVFRSGIVIALVLGYVSAIVVWSIIRRRPGAVPAAVGVLFLLAAEAVKYAPLPNVVYWNAAGLILFIFSIAISTSRQLRSANEEKAEAELRSARLEADLLKRSIQPHFLMNTLLSVLSWIRKDPATAALLIQDLAHEFRAINEVSGRRRITLAEEIALCQRHLSLMGLRNDTSYELVADAAPPDLEVPPLLLHTLIENGLTHAFATGESGRFVLDCERDGDRIVLRLRNGGSRLPKLEAILESDSRDRMEEGMGLQYVRARLEEAFTRRWSLEYGVVGAEWITTIHFPSIRSGASIPRGSL